MEIAMNNIKNWVKLRDNPLSSLIYRTVQYIRGFHMPVIAPLHRTLYLIHKVSSAIYENFTRMLYWTPLFQTRLSQKAINLYLYSGMPYVSGNLAISIGEHCRISGKSTFSGRTASKNPQLIIGNNVDIGWQTTIAVGNKVVIGDNVRIAGCAFLAGYPGHPLNAEERAKGMPDLDEQVGDIIIEDDVWVATGCSIMSGVRIGKGTIIAAGSVVTNDLPSNVLAGGVPARVIKRL